MEENKIDKMAFRIEKASKEKFNENAKLVGLTQSSVLTLFVNKFNRDFRETIQFLVA
jgi:antitoxin component of RelBE/YafQ-DinJ toxin-antitoxin module